MKKFYIFKLKELKEPNKLKELFSSLLFYFAILFFIIGFGFRDTPTPFGWYQQFMPNQIYGQIRDICFVDSLTGFAVTDSTIFKTTNSGDNWTIKLNPDLYIFEKIQFLNKDTGFICAGNNKILKTTNSGENWTSIIPDLLIYPYNMWVLNTDTIWLVNSGSGAGGVYRTTNGGLNWIDQGSFGSNNPDHIYIYDARIGYFGNTNFWNNLYKTTNSGQNWFPLNDTGFTDMYFKDSLTGWMANGFMKKTTDGGLSWTRQIMPQGGNINYYGIWKFSNINKDTIWGVGGGLYIGNNEYGTVYKTTNSGNNWGFQLPDTSIHSGYFYKFNKFINKLNGWAYLNGPTGIHTITGGDSITYTGNKNKSINIPKEFLLYQNYPNPFNPVTNIKYSLAEVRGQKLEVRIVIYNILGKKITELVNKNQNPGEYEVTFDGSKYSSGVYFYCLFVNNNLIDTKKMLMIK